MGLGCEGQPCTLVGFSGCREFACPEQRAGLTVGAVVVRHLDVLALVSSRSPVTNTIVC